MLQVSTRCALGRTAAIMVDAIAQHACGRGVLLPPRRYVACARDKGGSGGGIRLAGKQWGWQTLSRHEDHLTCSAESTLHPHMQVSSISECPPPSGPHPRAMSGDRHGSPRNAPADPASKSPWPIKQSAGSVQQRSSK